MSEPVWKNRIVRYSDEAPDQLLANPKNYRTHPGSQANALRGVLAEVGVVQNVLANVHTGMLIDGHLRVMEALKAGQPTIPVTWVDLTEAEEAVILATLDPLSAMAGVDAAKLDELLREVSTGDASVQAMLDQLAQDAPQIELPDEELHPHKSVEDYALNTVRKIEMLFDQEEYDHIMRIVWKVRKTNGFDDNTSAICYMLREYEHSH